uniref:Uncharacterized protein n=1 Tax=viral metagenome TaxID=1070528 RepID=A0A6M3M5Z7_9ZZZZ
MRKLSRQFIVRNLPDDLKIEAAKQDLNYLQAALKAFKAFAESKIK